MSIDSTFGPPLDISTFVCPWLLVSKMFLHCVLYLHIVYYIFTLCIISSHCVLYLHIVYYIFTLCIISSHCVLYLHIVYYIFTLCIISSHCVLYLHIVYYIFTPSSHRTASCSFQMLGCHSLVLIVHLLSCIIAVTCPPILSFGIFYYISYFCSPSDDVMWKFIY